MILEEERNRIYKEIQKEFPKLKAELRKTLTLRPELQKIAISQLIYEKRKEGITVLVCSNGMFHVQVYDKSENEVYSQQLHSLEVAKSRLSLFFN